LVVGRTTVERDLAVIQSKLDDAKFAKLADEGKVMTIEQAIEYALQFAESP